ncbi:MAG: septum formation initiator family protein [Candidatus Omnitrophica bacterium]|nr:septum formation initiator family protein [Candidatus Omnitrophota bacterium]
MFKNALWLFVVSSVLLVMFLPSYTKLQDLRQANTDYERKLKELTAERSKLLAEKKRLEEDPIYLEKVARERMGLIREGEVVYKITPLQKISEGGTKPVNKQQ